MITKYFLHGGRCELESESNKKFYEDIVNHFPKESLNILCVYFARLPHRWEESFEEDRVRFSRIQNTKKLNLQMAELENLDKQISNSDICFFAGGIRGCLKEKLLEIDTKDLFEGKLIIGVSAGANILSKYYYSCVANEVREGVGVLPIKMFTHFSEEKGSQLCTLKEFGEQLAVYTVKEQEYIVLKVGV